MKVPAQTGSLDTGDTLTSPGATPADKTPAQLPPEPVGRYRFDQPPVEIGRGGIGRVLEAHDAVLGRPVAVKELLIRGEGGAGASARFLREAQVTAQLEHPGIIPVHELGRRADGTTYYTMKRIRGQTLAEKLGQRDGLMERLQLLPVFVSVCQAIASAHSRGVVHRDLKPQNVMIGEFGETVVLDWGLCKVRGAAEPAQEGGSQPVSDPASGSNETVAGLTLGTPSYMPPEQALGDLHEVDERSDVFSLGAVLHELLTGVPPYSGKSVSETVALAVAAKLRPVREREAGIPADLAAIADKALSREKARRYASAGELAGEIQAWLLGGRVRAHEYSSAELIRRFVRHNRGPVAISLLAVVLLVVLGTVSYWRVRRERDDAFALARFGLLEMGDFLVRTPGSEQLIADFARRTLPFFERGLAMNASSYDDRMGVAISLERMGAASRKIGDLDQAERLLRASLQEYLRADADFGGPARLGDKEWPWTRVQSTRIQLADTLILAKRPAEGEALLQTVVAQAREMTRQRGDRSDTWKMLSASSSRLGERALAAGALPDARRFFEEALQASREAEGLEPVEDGNFGGLSVAYSNLGKVAMAEGLREEARRHFETALGLDERQAAAAPGDKTLHWFLAVSQHDLGRLSFRLGQTAASRELFGRSFATLDQIMRRGAEDVDLKLDFVEACHHAGQWARGLEVLQALRNDGVERDSLELAWVEALLLNGRFTEAAREGGRFLEADPPTQSRAKGRLLAAVAAVLSGAPQTAAALARASAQDVRAAGFSGELDPELRALEGFQAPPEVAPLLRRIDEASEQNDAAAVASALEAWATQLTP